MGRRWGCKNLIINYKVELKTLNLNKLINSYKIGGWDGPREGLDPICMNQSKKWQPVGELLRQTLQREQARQPEFDK